MGLLLQTDKINNFPTLEEEILILQKEGKNRALSLAEILRVLSGKGRPLILVLLSLPFCQPIQIPGLSTPFGLAIAFIGFRMVFGKRIWLPASFLKKKIPNHTLIVITDKALNLIKKIKPWIHPRLTWLCRSSFMEKGNGLMVMMLGIFLALPLPIPLSNLTAAWSIFLIALGILEDDGFFIIVGYIFSILTILFVSIITLSVKNYISY